MALTGVEAAGPAELPRATELAAALGVSVVSGLNLGGLGVRVVVGPAGLALAFEDQARGKSFILDLTETWRRPPLARGHIFRRALGSGRTLIDATAGFGRDAVRALSLGFEVTAVERSPVVFATLADAAARARLAADMHPTLERLHLVNEDASAYLQSHRADVIYLDPMFVKLKSTAKSPKEMQILQDILDEDDPLDEHRVFETAMAAARTRVVVKRALKSRPSGPRPSHTFKGQSVRYDVYQR